MRRKVVRQGDNALTVTLPAQWTKEHNVRAGDEIEIVKKGTVLEMYPLTQKRNKTTTITVTGAGSAVKRMVTATFKAGFDEIIIRFSTSEELAEIETAIEKEFVGFEILEVHSNYIHLKKIASIQGTEFDALFRKIWQSLLTIAEDTSQEIGKNKDSLKLIAMRDKNINKLTNVCRRAINEQTLGSSYALGPLYLICESLEKIGDVYRDICLFDCKIEKEMKKQLNTVTFFLRKTYDLYYNFSTTSYKAYCEEYHIIKHALKKISFTSKNKDYYIFINQILSLTFDLNGSIAVYHFNKDTTSK
ncbi:MAG: AbrB/MazE/SpoVT family DNA-binding domain-containing protein, partial [Candidatus Woesearchaeota archaeon]